MKSLRQRRVSDLIAREIAYVMRTKAADKRFDLITVTGAKVSKDLKIAYIYYSIFKDDPKTRNSIKEILEKAKGFFRAELGQTLKMKFTPELRFEFDDSIDRGHRIIEEIEKLEIDETPGENDDEF